jgi:hypothetical protein
VSSVTRLYTAGPMVAVRGMLVSDPVCGSAEVYQSPRTFPA